MFADEAEDGFCEVFDHILGLWLSDASGLIAEVAHTLSFALPFNFLISFRALHLPSWAGWSWVDNERGELLLRGARVGRALRIGAALLIVGVLGSWVVGFVVAGA